MDYKEAIKDIRRMNNYSQVEIHCVMVHESDIQGIISESVSEGNEDINGLLFIHNKTIPRGKLCFVTSMKPSHKLMRGIDVCGVPVIEAAPISSDLSWRSDNNDFIIHDEPVGRWNEAGLLYDAVGESYGVSSGTS